MAMSVKLLDEFATDLIFKNDEIYQALKQQQYSKNGVARDVKIEALEIKYGGTTNAAFTELGSAAASEFNGSAFEKSTVLCKTMVLSPGGSYFTFEVSDNVGAITKYYSWFLKYQVQTVVCLTAALTTSGTYFTIYDSEVAPTGYYVWLDKNGDGTTDKPTVAVLTEIVCNISGATTADDVGVIVAAAIAAKAGFGASNTTGTVTITHATAGSPSADAVDVDTTYVIAKTQNGGVDPSVSGYTGAEMDIKAATTADSVGAIVAGVITALSNVSSANSSGTVTITNAENFAVEATADGAIATGFTITRVETSASFQGGAPLYIKSASGDDIDLLAKDMRKDTIIGFAKDADGIPYLTEEEVSLAGATVVKTALLKWIRLIHHKGSDWGTTDQNAAGNISVEDIATTAFQLITAAFNESEGGVIWVPNGYHCMIAEAHLKLNDIVQVITDGGIVKFVKYGFDETQNNRLYNLKPDNPDIPIVVTTDHPTEILKWLTKSVLHGTDVAKLTISEAGINNTPIIEFRTYILLWYQKDYTTT